MGTLCPFQKQNEKDQWYPHDDDDEDEDDDDDDDDILELSIRWPVMSASTTQRIEAAFAKGKIEMWELFEARVPL